ncbi:MAG: AraC family transcriptional regulator [Cyclobacteriaceae bacterium]|nr:AraC family transcriptional regulator [Cyclobacteriaceae bacterium]
MVNHLFQNNLNKIKDIPTLSNDGFKIIMSYYDPIEYSKKNFNDFYIHGLSDKTYEIKIPLPPHRQTNNSIILVTKGSLVSSSGFDNFKIDQNSMIVVPAGQITSLLSMSSNIEGYYLHFGTNYLSQTNLDFSDWLTRPVIRFKKDEVKHLTTLLHRMQRLNERGVNTAILKLYLKTFLAEMKQSIDFQMRMNLPAHERITIDFKKLLNYNIRNHQSAGFYAEKLHITTNHLNKSVKATLRRSASSLIDETLVVEAKIVMQESRASISEVAFELGFHDPSYFGRFFKKHTGFVPNEYRKMIELSE